MLRLTLMHGVLLFKCFATIFKHGEALSVNQWQHNQKPIFDVGTTSVNYALDGSSIVVGTKKGGIFLRSLNNEDETASGGGNASENDIDCWSKVRSDHYETKYPIYSLASASQTENTAEPKGKIVFCGSGDRWISVWKVVWDGSAGNPIPPNVEFLQKLGPHTGWVKSLVYDDENQLLHSIGCNCIESWDCSKLNAVERRKDDDTFVLDCSHIAKRTIENCPTMGVTLSSDLLSLCLMTLPVGSNERPSRCLISGGVDGRIHLWISDPRENGIDNTSNNDRRNPLHTALAHNGRVNAIVYSPSINAIFTVGHDGALSVFRVSFDKGFELLSKLIIEDDSKETVPRLTAAVITTSSEEQDKCSLALGSSSGDVYFTTVEIDSDGELRCALESNHATVEEGSMIYSLCCEGHNRTESPHQLWVGHASGLITFENIL